MPPFSAGRDTQHKVGIFQCLEYCVNMCSSSAKSASCCVICLFSLLFKMIYYTVQHHKKDMICIACISNCLKILCCSALEVIVHMACLFPTVCK